MFKKFSAVLMAAICSVVSLAWFTAVPASALQPGDVVMSLNPSERDLELEPGKAYNSSVKVTNIGRLAFDVKASVSPYYVSDDDYTPDFNSESSYAKLHSWIKLEKDLYHLEPAASAEVKFTVTVPEDAVSGGQYAAIMLLSDSGEKDDSAVQVHGQLAAIIYGHIDGGEIVQQGELLQHDLPRFVFDKNLSISQTVKNTGNVDFRVRQTLIVRDFFSNREIINADSVDENGKLIGYNLASVLPGTSRTGILTWSNPPLLGLFNVTQEIAFLDQTYEYNSLVLICPIWLLVIVIALIIALIVWFIFKLRSKKQSKTNPELY